MNFFEEFSKLSDKDKKEVLDIMKYKRNLENEELKKRLKKYEDPEDLTLMFMYCDLKAKDTIKELQEKIEKLENVIVGLECDIKVLQEQIEDDCIAHEEANKWCKETQELSIRINKAIEYIENNSLYETEYDYDYEENSYLSGIDDKIAKKDLLEILKGE